MSAHWSPFFLCSGPGRTLPPLALPTSSPSMSASAWLPSPAHPPRLSRTALAGVLRHRLRPWRSKVDPSFGSPRIASIIRILIRRRSAHAARRHLVGALQAGFSLAALFILRLLAGRYAPDLTRDRVHVWLPSTLAAAHHLRCCTGSLGAGSRPRIPSSALRHAALGNFLRVTSACTQPGWSTQQRTCGSRRFETTDDSRNNWWVALLTVGKAGTTITMRIGQRAPWSDLVGVDVNYYGIWVMEKLGLAARFK